MSAVPGPPGQPAQPPSSGASVPKPAPGVPATAPLSGPVVPAKAQSPDPIPPDFVAKTPWTAYIKPILWTIVAIYVITFVFLNREIVVINFIFFQASVPLIFILVGLALIGAALCAGVMIMTRRRATKRAETEALAASQKK